MKTVMLIDGLNMFIRSYIVNPTMDKHGNPIGGCIGFLKSLQKTCNKFNPDEIVVCWDGHGGSQKRKQLNKSYKAGRAPIRFNRRLIDLPPEKQEENKAYQLLRLMEYLNELPIVQLVIDFVEADDIIAFGTRNIKYDGWNKIIVSSDKDFFQLCSKDTCVYRPIQDKLVCESDILNEYKIHPNNFALARAIVGDKSDNLEGVPGAGIKTVAKRFPFLSLEEESDCETIVKNCHMAAKRLKLHENIIRMDSRIKNNYQIMQLKHPNISIQGKMQLEYALQNFEPAYSKMGFVKMLFEDDCGHLNFDNLNRVMKKIKTT
tara:strand:- start:422 stop:1375 length:954 start_codon:yes stop_codon:yes gene_type:complete